MAGARTSADTILRAVKDAFPDMDVRVADDPHTRMIDYDTGVYTAGYAQRTWDVPSENGIVERMIVEKIKSRMQERKAVDKNFLPFVQNRLELYGFDEQMLFHFVYF